MQLPCQWWAIDRSCNVNQRAEASRLSHLCRIRIRARNTTKIVPLSRPWGDDARVPLATMPGVSLEICTDRQVSWWPLAARSPAPTFTQEIISPYNSRLKLPITMHFSLILKCSSVLCQTVSSWTYPRGWMTRFTIVQQEELWFLWERKKEGNTMVILISLDDLLVGSWRLLEHEGERWVARGCEMAFAGFYDNETKARSVNIVKITLRDCVFNRRFSWFWFCLWEGATV